MDFRSYWAGINRKWKLLFGVLLGTTGFLILLWLFRISILSAMGSYLIRESEAVPAQRIFVLGGGSLDRGFKAARLWHQGFAPQIICTGAHISGSIRSIGLEYTEAEVTQMRIQSLDVDSSLVQVLNMGTSTMEESDIILNYCLINDWNKIIIVSDKFHTHRIRDVFVKKFRKAGIEVIIVGAASSRYDENEWWKKEEGLIMVNNEYIKHLYYWWKY
jgi:uncharacterized SAM-binding protein YcdF (DUF218 family)